MATIVSFLRSGLGHDFAHYNENTLARRIQRRMQVLRIETVQRYIRQLRDEPRERELLFQELLINVTEFFRDPAAFEVLETSLLPTLIADKTDIDQIRVWIPGCATGEEVYSIAILVKEEMDRRSISPRVQIFGTDIDENPRRRRSRSRAPDATRNPKVRAVCRSASRTLVRCGGRWLSRGQADPGNVCLLGSQRDQRSTVFQAGSGIVP